MSDLEMQTSTNSSTYSPRVILPHLMSTDTNWTTELELELLEFAEICEDYAIECEKEAYSKHKSNTVYRIVSMFCSGAAAILPQLQQINTGISSYVVTGVSTISLGVGVVQSVCGFEKSSAAERNASVMLREISKEIRLEISKPLRLRWVEPYEKMMSFEEKFSEIVRRISPKVIDNDIKNRLRNARKARTKQSTNTPSR